MVIAAIGVALVFAMTNGLHDSANAIATLVATRALRPGAAVCLAAAGNIVGPLVFGKAVADTVAGIVTVPSSALIVVLGAAVTGAASWNILTWSRGFPSSSSHALLGGLVGATIAQAGVHGVHWGGFRGFHAEGVFGVVAVLALAPLIGFTTGFVTERAARRATRRATQRARGPVRVAQVVMAGALAFSHGANDAQKTIGVVTLVLLAGGEIHKLSPPAWAVVACGAALTTGTALGGWPIVRTIGRRIVRLRPIDSLASQTASTIVLLSASLIGAPVSTTQVVASSVVGVGAGRRRWRHVHWPIVRNMLLAWLVTVPAAAALSVAALVPWRWFA